MGFPFYFSAHSIASLDATSESKPTIGLYLPTEQIVPVIRTVLERSTKTCTLLLAVVSQSAQLSDCYNLNL